MELFFLRHGPAEPKTGWSGDDLERPLSAEGQLLVAEVAAVLANNPARPELILTSPYDRARQTAVIVAGRLGLAEKVVVERRLIPGFGLRQLEKVLQDHADRHSILLVGHGPDFSRVVCTLTGGRLTIRKGGVAQVKIEDVRNLKARLVSLIAPAPFQPQDESSDQADN